MGKYTINDTTLTGIADAIRTKEETTEPVPVADMAKRILAIETGTKLPDEDKEIHFYDYDGTLLYAYTMEEFTAMEGMPPLPSHEGLICQGWNWERADILAESGYMSIGAIYTTDNGETRLYITLEDGDDWTVRLQVIEEYGMTNVTIDWGDGNNEPVTRAGEPATRVRDFYDIVYSHTYRAAGDYIIRLTVTSGTIMLGHGDSEFLMGELGNMNNTALRKAEIGAGVEEIENDAFRYCTRLETVTIPNTVEKWGYRIFGNCYCLRALNLPNKAISSSHVLYECHSCKAASLPNNTSILNAYLRNCIHLPRFHMKKTITKIGDYAVYYCTDLKNIKLPDSITSIGKYAFSSCKSLGNIKLPESLQTIGEYAFQGCSGLEKTNLPSKLQTIGQYAFYVASLTEIDIPAGVTTIGDYGFAYNYKMRRITMQEGLTSIGQYGFVSNFLVEELSLPDSLISIRQYAFAYLYCLRKLKLPDTMNVVIGDYAFKNCENLTEVLIPENTYYNIGKYAFQNCYGLKKVTFGKNGISTRAPDPGSLIISDFAFSGCGNIEEYDFTGCRSGWVTLGTDVFSGRTNYKIRVERYHADEYFNDTKWKPYLSHIYDENDRWIGDGGSSGGAAN